MQPFKKEIAKDGLKSKLTELYNIIKLYNIIIQPLAEATVKRKGHYHKSLLEMHIFRKSRRISKRSIATIGTAG